MQFFWRHQCLWYVSRVQILTHISSNMLTVTYLSTAKKTTMITKSNLHHKQTERSESLCQQCKYCHLHLREFEPWTFDPDSNTAPYAYIPWMHATWQVQPDVNSSLFVVSYSAIVTLSARRYYPLSIVLYLRGRQLKPPSAEAVYEGIIV